MKILVVEDEHKIAHAIKAGLEHERMIVDVTFTGADGYDLADSEKYDVIVLDWMLPDKSGIEIIQSLRQKGNHTPVLLLTAKGQVDDKVTGLDSGADDYMVKPFAFTELVSRIRALSRRPQTRQSHTIGLEDLTLNRTSFEVSRNNRSIALSVKEFALLEYLISHPHQIVSKQTLMQNVWSYDSDILPNTVEVYIKKLREKVDKGEEKKLIHTVRGFGYKLG